MLYLAALGFCLGVLLGQLLPLALPAEEPAVQAAFSSTAETAQPEQEPEGENLFAGQTLAIADRTLLYACIGAAVLAVITGLLAWMIKTPGGKRLCTALSTAAAAYALSSVLITGGQLICYSGYRPQLDYMITLSVLLTATAFCAIELYCWQQFR